MPPATDGVNEKQPSEPHVAPNSFSRAALKKKMCTGAKAALKDFNSRRTDLQLRTTNFKLAMTELGREEMKVDDGLKLAARDKDRARSGEDRA
ncbi:hypothetical protein NL676_020141 [Syzygium grande]|nr:hypothetical protein NL676_020141 [Syzygium grande]